MFAFPPQTQAFLRDLAAHNDRAWFATHRGDYEAAYLEPARAFVEAVAPALGRISPGLRAEPRIPGSIFRINRDTRFTRDRRPYKEHLDVWFWEGDRRGAVSGLYLRVTPALVAIGAGANHLRRETLARYRAAVAAARPGAALAGIVAAVEDDGWELGEPRLRRVPADWRAAVAGDEARARLLRRDALFVARREPAGLATDAMRLVPACIDAWTRLAPLHRWLVEHVQ